MKILVTMKDPDTLQDAISDAVKEELKKSSLSADDQEALFDNRLAKAATVASKWFQYGEYVTIEIDTDAQTAVVCPLSEH